METYRFINIPAVHFLYTFATSNSWHTGFLSDCLRDFNRARRRSTANLPCAANHYSSVAGSEPLPRLDFYQRDSSQSHNATLRCLSRGKSRRLRLEGEDQSYTAEPFEETILTADKDD